MPRYGTTPSERATMSRALAILFAAGATLVFLTLALPHAADTEEAMLALAAGLAYVVSALLWGFAEELSLPVVQLVLAAGTLLIGVCVAFGGSSASAYPLMFLWVSLFAYFFFRRTVAALEVAFIGVVYAGALAVQEHPTPVPGIHWLMTVGAVGVGGVLLGRLADAIRAQAADISAVSQMSGRLGDASQFEHETCAGLQRSARADAVVMFEPSEDDGGLTMTAMSGVGEAGLVFNGSTAHQALERCFAGGAALSLLGEDPPGGIRALRGNVVGWAQPVLRNGQTVAILAIGWTTPRRRVPDRVRSTALLFAAETSVVMERAERQRLDRERHALEINDNIVQGLVVAKYCAQRGDHESSIAALDETLERARGLISDQLRWVGERRGGIRPGDLAREQASSVAASPEARPAAPDGR